MRSHALLVYGLTSAKIYRYHYIYISKKWIKMCLSVGRLKAIFVYVFAYSIGVFTLVEKVGASSIFLGTILREVSLWPGPGAVSPTQAEVVTFNSALFKISDVNGVWLKSLELKGKEKFKSRDRITSNPEARDFLKIGCELLARYTCIDGDYFSYVHSLN